MSKPTLTIGSSTNENRQPEQTRSGSKPILTISGTPAKNDTQPAVTQQPDEPFQLRMAKQQAAENEVRRRVQEMVGGLAESSVKDTQQKRANQAATDKEYRNSVWDFLNTMISNAGAGGAGVVAAPMDAAEAHGNLQEAKQASDEAAAAFDKQSFGERQGHELSGWGQRTVGNLGNTLLTLGDAYNEADARAQAYDPNNLLISQMLGQDPVKEAERQVEARTGAEARAALDKAYSSMDRIADRGNEELQRAKDGASALGRLGLDLETGALDLGADFVTNKVIPGAGLVAMSGRVFGEAAREERQKGGDLGRQMLAGTKAAAIEVITEKIGGPFEKIYGKSFAGKAINKAIDAIDSKGGRAAIKLLSDALGEGAEEVLSDLLNPTADYLLGLSGSWGDAWSDTTAESVLYDGLLGTLLGAAGSAGQIISTKGRITPADIQQIKADAQAAGENAVQEAAQQAAPAAAENTAQSAEIEREASGDTPAPPATENAATGESGRLNRASVAEETATVETPQNERRALPEEARKKLKKVDAELVSAAINATDPMAYAEENSYAAQHDRVTGYIAALLQNPALTVAETAEDRREMLNAFHSGEVLRTPEALLYALYADTTSEQTTLNAFLKAREIGDRQAAERMLNGLSVNHPELVNYSSTLGLDRIDLPANGVRATEAPPTEAEQTASEQAAMQPTAATETPTAEPVAGTPMEPAATVETPTEQTANAPAETPTVRQRPETKLNADLSDNGTEAKLQEAVEKYGVIPEGEKAARESQIPTQMGDDTAVGRTARTLYEAKATPEERLQDINNAVVNGVFNYVPETNDQIRVRARERIRRNGWGDSVSQFLADVRNGRHDADTIATGAVILNNAMNGGMTGAQYAEVVAAYAQAVHGTARALAAARLMKSLTPEARLYGIQKQVQEINDGLAEKAQRQAARRKRSRGENVPVEEWAQTIGENLAEQFGTQNTAKPEKNGLTTAQIIEREIKSIIEDAVPKDKKNRVKRDKIADALNNLDFYNRVYEQMRDTLSEQTDIPKDEISSVVGDWAENTLPDLLMQSAVKNPDIKIDPSLIEKYMAQADEAGRDAVIDEMMQNVADQMPSTLMDKWTALRYVNMLGNFKTQARNLIGNVLMGFNTAIKSRIGAAIEAAAQATGAYKGERTKSVWAGHELYGEAWNDYNNVKDVAEGEGKYQDSSNNLPRAIQDKRTIFKNNGKWGTNEAKTSAGRSLPVKAVRKVTDVANKGLEGYRKATNWAMTEGDNIFLRFTYMDALGGYLAANKVKHVSDASPELLDRARAYAIKQAQEATFHDSNGLSEWASSFDRGWDKTTAGKVAKTVTQGVLPFRKTPANVLVRAEEYSPVGVLNTLVKAVQAAEGKPDVSGADVIESLSKTLTGSSLTVLGYLLGMAGKARAKGSDDDKLKKLEAEEGKQDYSVTLGDGSSLSLEWAAPSSIPFFMGARLAEITDGESPYTILTLLGGVTDPVLQMSMLSGLNDALNNLDKYNGDIEAVPSFMLNSLFSYLTQGMTNSLVGQAEQASEEYRRSTYTDKESPLSSSLQYALSRAGAKTPGVDYHQQDYYDAWGRKVENGTTGERIMSAFFSPAYKKEDRTTEVDDELARLYKETGENVLGTEHKPKRGDKINGEVLSPEEFEQYSVTRGELAYDMIDGFIKSDEYKNLSDADRAEIILNLYQFAADQGKKEIARDRGEEYANTDWNKVEALAQEDEDEAVNYLSVRTAAKNAIQGKNYDVLDQLLGDGGAYHDLGEDAQDMLFSSIDGLKRLVSMRGDGVSAENAMKVSDTVKALKPEGESKAVTQAQKVSAIIGMDMSDADKLSAIKAFTSDEYAEKVQAAVDSGVSLDSWGKAYTEYNRLQNGEGTAQNKATDFAAWLDKNTNLTASQKDVVQEQLSFFSMNKAEPTHYDGLRKSKVNEDTARRIANAMTMIQPLEGKTQATQEQKVDTILGMGLSDGDTWAALKEYTSESYYNKAAEAYRRGIDLDDYARQFREADLPNDKGETNGQLSQDELWKYYKANPSNETFVKVMWLIGGFKTDWDTYKRKHE